MHFESTPVRDVVVVDLDPVRDERGYFARAWCRRELEAHGLETDVVQCNLSHNFAAGTIRGLHRQVEPHAEAKLVRVTRGAVFDVAVDVRPDSDTYKQWFGIELSAQNGRMLYVPQGCLHGYQTLAPDTEVFYQVTAYYEPSAERGCRYDDPAFGVEWPLPPHGLSAKDLAYGPFDA